MHFTPCTIHHAPDPRYASHLGLPAIMVSLHGTSHTNLARYHLTPHIFTSTHLAPFTSSHLSPHTSYLRLVSNHIAKGAGFQVWVQVHQPLNSSPPDLLLK